MVQVNHYTSPEISGPYSQAVRCGNFLFVGSQSSTDLKTLEFIDGTIEQQTQIVLNNIVKILNDAGYDSSHIVHCTIYLRDRNDYQKMNLVYGGYFEEGKYPTRSVIIGTEFRNPKTRVEISAIAYKPH
ncbi:MAG: RidA family protein [Bacteroidetes bacterium]|nr:RidA family protein [Bacteroidota bacterium]